MTEKPSIFSTFCGPGGMDLGFEKFFDIDYAIDVETNAFKTYQANHHSTQVQQRDIRDTSGAKGDFSGITGMIGGPPCQQWSRRNIRKKKDDPRRLLAGEYLRLVGEIRPEFFVLENVVYAPQTEKLKVIKAAKKLGYNVGSYCINAADYGSAQNRRRWVVVGTQHGSWSPARIIPVTSPKTVRMAFKSLLRNWGYMNSRPDTIEKLSRATTDWSSLSGEEGDYETIVKLLWDQPSPTVVNVKKIYMVHPSENRNITSAEAAALQGFPNEYIWHGDQHAIGQLIANAMPVELATRIAESIAGMIV